MRNNKLNIILFILLITSVTAFSQSTTNSPYSKYGIGIIRPQTFASNFGMGGVGIGLRSNKDIGLLNPASYSAITVTTFDVGVTNNALWLSDKSENEYQNNPYIDHVAFAFPIIKNKWGISFGVLPFSNVGYDYDEIINDSIAGDISIFSNGRGAINKVYLGNAIAINIDSTSKIAVGANMNFYFGSMSHDYVALYGNVPNGFNLLNTREISVADFGADLGLQYQKTFTSDGETYLLNVGATYSIASDLKSKRTEGTVTFDGTDNFISFSELKDTIDFNDDVNDIVQLPSTIGFGVSLEKQNKWLLAADYKTTNWGSIASNNSIFDYKSNYALAAGVEFIPKYDGSNYIQRVAYRLGTRFSNSYIAINDVDWSEYGITFGIGLPVRRSESTYPRLNLGFEYGSRGTSDSGLIKETFFNFNVGVTINALWFRKRKYD